MTNKKPTQFKLKDIQAQAKELTKVSKFYLDKEETSFINYYPKFSKKKSHDLFVELSDTIKKLEELKLDFPSNDLELIQYVQFLIIKHFTSLKSELNGKSIEVHIETMIKLLETGLFERFFSEMFDMAEVHDLLEDLDKKAELGLELIRIKEESNAELAEKLKSDVLKNKEG